MNFITLNRAHEIRANGHEIKVLKVCVASIKIEIDCLYGSHFNQFKAYLKDFQTPDIVLTISQEDIDHERSKHPEMKTPDIVVENPRVTVTFDYGCLEPFVALHKLAEAIIPFEVFLMHGAVVEKDGFAYMFIAPSGTGKSTRVQLWKECYPDSIIVNGDKPLIKNSSEAILACGSPWCGKEGWNTNTMIPLRAIFLLERAAENDSSTIEEISIGEAFPFLLQQTFCPTNPRIRKIFRTFTIIR